VLGERPTRRLITRHADDTPIAPSSDLATGLQKSRLLSGTAASSGKGFHMIVSRLTAATGVAVATIALCVAAAPADGSASGPASASMSAHRQPTITAHPSDRTPHVGQEFVVRGVYDGPGRRAHDVKIQTFRNDRWLNLTGARVTTRADGSYRVRVILDLRGVRDLRAVGIAGPDHRNSYARFVVEVLP
jgi:hypothetical protein